MSVTNSQEGAVTIITVSGRLDSNESQGLEEKVVEVLELGGSKLLFDFNDLEYINSSGLRILVMAYQRLKKKTDGTVAICGLRDYIQEIFEISGYDRLFLIFRNKEDALTKI
ncbi:STAS domain-containing protein [Oceanidesulfovibrio marinus]|uniref:Anti-sigma factor antagonist n=1 Tax=Oceanidesulfovibrio marinus TaxID=370038 RepID=A0A6P1ZIG6_9BACT|nr:STAS domain-containing protein [Oceanidesulfovibrio marinus]QJT07498.1 STAS domain-containing protein [Oceanidesulfovibrio marinus]TVM34588.1 anti-sigma factor antagonist [Oceanidesulfovibrio marinus]